MYIGRFELAGVKVDAITLRGTVDLMHAWIQHGRRDYIVLTGVRAVVEMQADPELRAINNRAGLTTPAGMPLAWAGRALGFPEIEKADAPDIMNLEFSVSTQRGHRHFLYGGKPGAVDKLTRRITAIYPGLQITGTYCPPFRELTAAEEEDVVQRIDGSRADIVWCDLGCPKQEKWMARFRPRLQAPVLIGVGAGFESAYRAWSVPERLGKRSARVVPSFLYRRVREGLARVLRR